MEVMRSGPFQRRGGSTGCGLRLERRGSTTAYNRHGGSRSSSRGSGRRTRRRRHRRGLLILWVGFSGLKGWPTVRSVRHRSRMTSPRSTLNHRRPSCFHSLFIRGWCVCLVSLLRRLLLLRTLDAQRGRYQRICRGSSWAST